MIGKVIGLLFTGGYLIGVRPGLTNNNYNVLTFNDKFYEDTNFSYKNKHFGNISFHNYILFTVVEYKVTLNGHLEYTNYKFSFRPLKAYHNGELIHHE